MKNIAAQFLPDLNHEVYICRVSSILNFIEQSKVIGRPLLAVLIDPGKLSNQKLRQLLESIREHNPDLIFVGGSTSTAMQVPACVDLIRQSGIKTPVVLFPGHENQFYPGADALLLLSLISGRNADLLIGKHVLAAQELHASGMEIIPTGYMLIESGKLTTVAYMSQTQPLPRENAALAASTALAGQLLGMRLIYLEAGSGARWPVPPEMIHAVKQHLKIPLIVGGGIDSAEKLGMAVYAGADLVVVGNALESDPDLLGSLMSGMQAFAGMEQND
ncbi:MAG: geranylgeranylglyceryl/heptaprenylglyceryl phosphate synthase [Bacteroidetes bacterium]|nr:geranylgeranylglyceryl/heptaprenylglyceryl phosphate synthase [Bacteroidota bacterium]